MSVLEMMADKALVEDIQMTVERVKLGVLRQVSGLQVVVEVLRNTGSLQDEGVSVILENHVASIIRFAEELGEADEQAREVLSRLQSLVEQIDGKNNTRGVFGWPGSHHAGYRYREGHRSAGT